MELVGTGIIPGACHWTPEVSVTLIGKEMEQDMLRESPAIIGEGGEDVREMFAVSAHYIKRHFYNSLSALVAIPIAIFCPWILILDSVLELADTLTEVTPIINLVITTLVSMLLTTNEPLCPPSSCW